MNNDDLHKAQESEAKRRRSAESSKDDHSKIEQEFAKAAGTRLKRGRRSLSSIDSVLSKLVSTMGLDRRLKEHALLNLWPIMIGSLFSEKSRPLFIDHEGNLVIAVKDASVAQELSLLKPEIIKKMRIAAHSMGLTINGMRFDLKHFYGGTPALSEGERFPLHKQPRQAEPTPEELADVSLSESDLQELAALKAELPLDNASSIEILNNFKESDVTGESLCIKVPTSSADNLNTPELNQRIFCMFEQELKLRQWRRKQGFPLCPKCQMPTQSLHGPQSLCPDCYFTTLANARNI